MASKARNVIYDIKTEDDETAGDKIDLPLDERLDALDADLWFEESSNRPEGGIPSKFRNSGKAEPILPQNEDHFTDEWETEQQVAPASLPEIEIASTPSSSGTKLGFVFYAALFVAVAIATAALVLSIG